MGNCLTGERIKKEPDNRPPSYSLEDPLDKGQQSSSNQLNRSPSNTDLQFPQPSQQPSTQDNKNISNTDQRHSHSSPQSSTQENQVLSNTDPKYSQSSQKELANTEQSPQQEMQYTPPILPPTAEQQQQQQGQSNQQQPIPPPSYVGQHSPNVYEYPNFGPYNKVIFVPANLQPTMLRSGRTDIYPPELPIDGLEENQNGQSFGQSFTHKKVRRTFVRKVYFILTLQLIFTLGIVSLFVFEPNTKAFVQSNPLVYYLAFGIFFVVFFSLVCFPNLRRNYPANLVMLLIFTLAMSYMMGTISGFHDTKVVFMAVGICAAVCFAVTIFSFNTKFDFTSCGGILYILLLIVIVFGIVAIFNKSWILRMIYAGLGAIVFILYLAYDTQLIMGGKHREINPEEYIFASLMLYIDILYIYMHILLLFGYSN